MVRTIKFRAWDRKRGVMFPVHSMNFGKIDNELKYISGVDIHDKDSRFDGDVFYGGSIDKMTGTPLQPRFELMQFTGLRDSKRTEKYPEGQEIYEGDVVRGRWLNEGEDLLGVVVFHDAGFIVKRINGPDKDKWDLLHTSVDGYKVIGNIHDNPDLLETVE